MKPLEKVLERAANVQPTAFGWKVSCPVPGHGKGRGDCNPSVSVSEGDDGRVLVSCKAGCSTEDVVASWGLRMADLFEDKNGHRKKFSSTPTKTTATVQPCNLKTYAEAKGLPIEYLQKLGLSDKKYEGKDAVRIPYSGVDGQEIAVRFRLALEKSEEIDDRFKWRTGSKTALYGLWRLEKIKKAGWVVLVEGESDAQTLWYHDIPALGIPGVETWKQAWAEHLQGIEKIFAVIEPDHGGQALREKLSATTAIRERLYLVDIGEHKDPSGLYLADRDNFKDRFTAALKSAVSVVESEREEAEAASRQAWAECADLAGEPDILDDFAADLARSGVAGESRLAKLLYLAVTSRFLEHRPVSIAMKGPSSGGKSYLTERVLRFFPQSAYYALTAMSEHALAYSDEPLKHRFLVIFEAAGMSSDFATYLVRSLLSEGRVRYETVEKTADGMKPRLIEREGPTGLIVTTTAVKLHPENETRLLSLTVTDTREQTRDVMAALAKESTGVKIDLERWRALQEWLAGAEHRVTIPYSEKLAESVPPVAVRLRRDFGAILNLIKAHAILHQASRKRDAEGQIVAEIEDYAKVRELIADLVSEGIEATVPATVRETVETLRKMQEESEEPITIAELARELELDKSAAWRRVRAAMDRGYINNREDRKGRPARLVTGDDLPDDLEILPAPETLHTTHLYHSEGGLSHSCTVAGVQEGINHNFFSESGEDEAKKKDFFNPPENNRNRATTQPQREVFEI